MSQFSGSTMGRHSRIWLIITGGILLGVGAIMAVTLGGIPFAGGAMLATGGFMALVGVVLIVVGLIVGRRAQETDQILASGVAGTAQVTGVTQTGMYLNEQPQLRLNLLVSLPGQVPYATTHTSFVPLLLLGRVTSGMPLAVRVDPIDLNKVVVDWGASGFTTAPVMPVVPSPAPAAATVQAAAMPPAAAAGTDESLGQVQAALGPVGGSAPVYGSSEQAAYTVDQLRAWLRTNGQVATARVDRLDDSGQVVGDERLYTMEMTLNIPGREPQKLPSSAAMVPVGVTHKVFQGMSVPVRYAAENPNLLMVEWEKV